MVKRERTFYILVEAASGFPIYSGGMAFISLERKVIENALKREENDWGSSPLKIASYKA